ncbi:F0F1 ATP synthase subunit epsilon [Sulfidibacter corallicola]|uniref:ATP synthase epsilon chain n=1 Tax=Sulfidibacter corallicola TaxID=2818388 RepID=A0A8A4TXT2_SULCO|nr:F0F1 ATP synthase subunit epsilon [Sulfidibacter corallicola]QTD54293.1 F0F1 ATP synthase subunit epsilon [Sulfidibacter corallicola]
MELQVLTPEKKALEEDVASVYLQGSQGRLGILPQHTSFLSKLDFGVLEYEKDGSKKQLLCGSGLIEVMENKVIVLVRSAETPDDVDVERAKDALQRAKSRLGSKDKDVDLDRAHEAQLRAIQRLKFLGKL